MNIEQVCKIFLVAATKFYFKRELLVWQITPQKNMNLGKKKWHWYRKKKPWQGIKKKKKKIVQRGWEVPAVGHVKWLRVHAILLSRKAHKK